MYLFKVLQNIIALPGLLSFASKAIKTQQQYMAKHLLPILEKSLKNNDQSISSKNIKRITSYYGMAVPIIGEAYKTMMGQQLHDHERKILNYMGALTCLFDDYFDEKTPDHQHIKALLNTPTLELAQNDHERLFLKLYQSTLKETEQKEFIKYSNLIHKAQLLSKEQTKANISPKKLKYITREKGGISILFYRFALENKIKESEKVFFYDIGLLGQLENDIFDIYEDDHAGIKTLANTTTSISELKKHYLHLHKKAIDSLMKLDFPERQKKRFAQLTNLIVSRGLVCLDQYQGLKNSHCFKSGNYSRKELICDMASLSNRFKWIKSYILLR